MLESGEYASLTELAAVEKINRSYVCRVLRLTLLALMMGFPVEWDVQRTLETGWAILTGRTSAPSLTPADPPTS